MTDNILATLLGSEAKAKLLRLFVSNNDQSFNREEISKKTQVKKDIVAKELRSLLKIKLIKKKVCFTDKKLKSGKISKKKTDCFELNSKFPYITALKHLLLEIAPTEEQEIARSMARVGTLKLLLLAGVFLQDKDARADLLIVAKNINEKKLNSAILKLEADMGRDISYVALTPEEFNYRLSMYDRLLRDIFDSPHKISVNKLGDFYKELSMART